MNLKWVFYDWHGWNRSLFETLNNGLPEAARPLAYLGSAVGSYWTAPFMLAASSLSPIPGPVSSRWTGLARRLSRVPRHSPCPGVEAIARHYRAAPHPMGWDRDVSGVEILVNLYQALALVRPSAARLPDNGRYRFDVFPGTCNWRKS